MKDKKDLDVYRMAGLHLHLRHRCEDKHAMAPNKVEYRLGVVSLLLKFIALMIAFVVFFCDARDIA